MRRLLAALATAACTAPLGVQQVELPGVVEARRLSQRVGCGDAYLSRGWTFVASRGDPAISAREDATGRLVLLGAGRMLTGISRLDGVVKLSSGFAVFGTQRAAGELSGSTREQALYLYDEAGTLTEVRVLGRPFENGKARWWRGYRVDHLCELPGGRYLVAWQGPLEDPGSWRYGVMLTDRTFTPGNHVVGPAPYRRRKLGGRLCDVLDRVRQLRRDGGEVYFADTVSSTIVVMDLDGREVRSFPVCSAWKGPALIAGWSLEPGVVHVLAVVPPSPEAKRGGVREIITYSRDGTELARSPAPDGMRWLRPSDRGLSVVLYQGGGGPTGYFMGRLKRASARG